MLVRSLDKTLRRLIKELDLPAFHSHLIRKTVATQLHYSGVATREIADVLGHEEIATTEKNYILSFEKNYDLMRNKMEEAFRSYGAL